MSLIIRSSFIFILFLLIGKNGFSIAYSEANTNPTKADTAYIHWLIAEGESIYMENLSKAMDKWESALNSANEALKSKHNTDVRKKLLGLKAKALNNIGYGYNERGKFKHALVLHKECLAIRKELHNDIEIAESFNNLAFSYSNMGDYRMAVDYNLKSLNIREKLKDTLGCAISLNNIGNLYQQMKDIKSALKFYRKSLKHYESIHDEYGTILALNNIALLIMNKETIRESKAMLDRALYLSKKNNSASYASLTLHNIGIYFRNLNQTEKSIPYFEQSLAIEDSLNNAYGRASELQTLGSAYYRLKQYDKAFRFLIQAEKISKENNYPSILRNTSENLHLIYASKNKFADAYKSLLLYQRLHDSLSNSELHRETVNKQMAYEYGKKTLADSLEKVHTQEQNHARQAILEAKVNRDKLQKWFLYAGICFVLIIAFIIWNRLKIIRKQKKMIELNKLEVEQKNLEITDSINYARRLQEAILPPEKFWKENLPESFVFYQPKDIVAGDFYWLETAHHQNEEIILFAAADCTGHGVPGAMVSVICCNALNRAVKEFGLTEPGKILDKTRELVLETFARSEGEVKDGMDISLCAYNKKSNILQWAGAHNPLWIISDEEQQEELSSPELMVKSRVKILKEIKPDKQHIGKTDHPVPFTTHLIKLQQDDLVVLFTDGYIDQFGGDRDAGSGKKFKSKRLKDLLIKNAWMPVHQQKSELVYALNKWQGSLEQTDDVCIIAVRI